MSRNLLSTHLSSARAKYSCIGRKTRYDEGMEYVIWSIAVLCFFIGLVGSLIPTVPGCLFILAGCVVRGVFGPVHIGWYAWVVLFVLLMAALLIDKILGGWGAKKFGGTNWGAAGAIIGAIVGSILFSPLIGLTVAPFVCAFAAEYLGARKRLRASLKAGTGATLGMALGMAVGVMINVAMITSFLFFYWHAS